MIALRRESQFLPLWSTYAILFCVESIQWDLGDFRLKPLYLVAPVGILLYFARSLAERKMIFPRGISLLVLYVASTIFTVAWGQIVSMSDLVVTLVGQLFLMLMLIQLYGTFWSRPQVAHAMFRTVAQLGVFAVLVGAIQVVLSLLGIHILEEQSGLKMWGFVRPASIFSEPDWFGLFSGYCLLYAIFAMPMENPKRRSLYIVIGGLGVLMSAARAPIMALGAVYVVWLAFGPNRAPRKVLNLLIVIVVTVAVFSALPSTVQNRFSGLLTMDSSVDDGAADSRLYTLQLSLDYIKESLWFGNGMGGLGKLSQLQYNQHLYSSGGVLNEGRGGTNLFVTTIFDVGIVGAIPFFLFIFRYLAMSIRNIGQKNLNGFAAAGFVYLLAEFMVNNAFRYTLVWLHLALFALIVRNSKQLSTTPAVRTDQGRNPLQSIPMG